MAQVFFYQFRTPSGIDQMVKADPRNIIVFKEIKNKRDFALVHPIYSEAQAHFESHILAVFDARHSLLKCPLFTPKPVIDSLQAV